MNRRNDMDCDKLWEISSAGFKIMQCRLSERGGKCKKWSTNGRTGDLGFFEPDVRAYSLLK